MSHLQGQIAIITGAGQKQGIGRAIAMKLAEQGANTILTDLQSSTELETIAADISKSTNTHSMGFFCDLTKAEEIEKCVEFALKEFGQIDILVNNAGVAGSGTNFLEIDSASWDLSYNVNIKGTVNFCRAILPLMTKQQAGIIVNNSSLCGLGALEAIPASYTATKFAIIGLTKSIALEFASQNIRCNAVCPGVVNTGMRQDALTRIAEQMNISLEEAEKFEDEAIAMKRAAEPEEVADAVAYLASPAASYITGVTLPVAGGLAAGL
ncbi:MAG: glucose 1-dehydrogenase [Gammaproteobacteria bacterium]|nr:glucose 1-dehydrogenase [Gammaproteobacteria bacterium]